MAVRKPLVLVGGLLKEIDPTDTLDPENLPAGGGGGSGDVTGPAAANPNEVAVFSDTTGKLIGNSGIGVSKTAQGSLFVTPDPTLLPGSIVAGENNNIGVGLGALQRITSGEKNVAIGAHSGEYCTTGYYNVVVGAYSQNNLAAGDRNIAVGANTQQGSLAGEGNVAIGSFIQDSLWSGNDNIGVGQYAQQNLTTGSANVCIGDNTGGRLTSGSNNLALGSRALTVNSTGGQNVAVGGYALGNTETSGYAVGLGYGAGQGVSTGSSLSVADHSVFIGFNTKAKADPSTNEIVIGDTAIGEGSNTARIGNASITLLSTAGQLSAAGSYTNTLGIAPNLGIDTDGKIYRSNYGAVIVIAHGTDGTVVRPANAGKVIWRGTATPAGAIEGDEWEDS